MLQNCIKHIVINVNIMTYEQTSEAMLGLFIKLFGKDIYQKINTIKITPIKYEGLDITGSKICVGSPDIKDRFTSDWVEYFAERGISGFDLFIQSVDNLGYIKGVADEKENSERQLDIYKTMLKEKFTKD